MQTEMSCCRPAIIEKKKQKKKSPKIVGHGGDASEGAGTGTGDAYIPQLMIRLSLKPVVSSHMMVRKNEFLAEG